MRVIIPTSSLHQIGPVFAGPFLIAVARYAGGTSTILFDFQLCGAFFAPEQFNHKVTPTIVFSALNNACIFEINKEEIQFALVFSPPFN